MLHLHLSEYASVSVNNPTSSANMSWAVEEWKDGLPAKALQKIQEIEAQLDKLKKERQQKQFQMDSLEATLQKQKQKVRNNIVDILRVSIFISAV